MIGRVVVLLLIGLAVVAAPVGFAEDSSAPGGGECIYTSQSGKGGASVGVNPSDCFNQGLL